MEYTFIKRSGPESPRNDTANIVEIPDGRLLAVWHRYRANPEGASDFGLADIAAAESNDGGRNWTNERCLLESAPNDINVQAPALCRLPSGELLLACNRAHAKDSTSMLLFRSHDDGESFTFDRPIWERSRGQLLQGGAASLTRLSSGRLLLPYHGGQGDQWGQHNVIRCCWSDDNGAGWRFAETELDLPMRGAMEPSIAELASGELVMSIRTQLGAVFISRSSDGGERWEPAQATNLRAPESCTCLRRIPGTDRLVLFWNDSLYDPNHHHYGIRTPLSAAVSDDGGKRFTKIGDIDDGDTMLTNLNCTFASNGTALLTYLYLEDHEISQGVYVGHTGDEPRHVHVGLKCAIVEREWFT